MYPEKIHLALGNLDNWCFGQFYHSKIEKLTLVCLSFSGERLNLRGFMFRKFVPRFLLGISGQKFSVCYMVYILISGNVSS